MQVNVLNNNVLKRKQLVIGAALILLANNYILCQVIH